MARLVTFSIGSIFLGCVAAIGLAAYTADHPVRVGLVEMVTTGTFRAGMWSRR